MTYRDRREAKSDRLEEWAEKRETKAATAYEGARQIADMIPFGQPILVGHHSEGRHRRDLDRIDRGMRRSFEDAQKAEEMRSRAAGIRSAAKGAIYSDDPDAIEALEARIVALEADREKIKNHNRAMRRPGACDHPADCDCRSRFPRECGCKSHPLPAYHLANLSGNISRQRARLEVLRVDKARAERAEATDGPTVEDQGHGYVSVTFPEKPDRAVLDALRGAGFQWRRGSWWGKRDALPEVTM